jgi:hypothetical protein
MHPKALAVIAARGGHPGYDPLYETDPHTGATIEIFFADRVLAASFGIGGVGWYFWSSWPGCRPGHPHGPYPTSYRAYGDALISSTLGRASPRGVQTMFDEGEAESTFRNYYRCASCGCEWTDVWSCQCDDDCPRCGARHMSPYKSEDASHS